MYVYIYICIYIYILCIHIYIYICIRMLICRVLYLLCFPPLAPSVSPSLYLYLSISLFLNFTISLSLYLYFSISQFTHNPSTHPPIHPTISINKLWLVVWNIFYFPIHWECHHPNWRTHMFQRGGSSTTNQHFFARKLKHIWWATMRCPRNPWIWSVSSTCRWVIWITRCHVGRQRKPNFNGWIELGYNITAGMPFTLIHSVPI